MKSKALKKHYQWRGKIGIQALIPLKTKEDLALAYTPGVADACLEIKNNKDTSYELTRRWNTVAVITDGTAVLGLGDIGPEASMPVMEGKCLLFKAFADIDAIPLSLKTKDTEELIKTIYYMSSSFGGINLEDISSPRCFEIERRLKQMCDIPVFHDDQHGTAIVVCAALKNALKLANKDLKTARIVINGVGAAGMAIGKMLIILEACNLVLVDKHGILSSNSTVINDEQLELVNKTIDTKLKGELSDVMNHADGFIGVSAGNILNKELIQKMNDKAIIFAMANPIPEVMPDLAKEAGVFIIGTGRSDYPNQINNLLAFPGVFKGALMSRASCINENMKIAAINALADLISENELNVDNIIPSVFDKRVVSQISQAVSEAAYASKVARK